MPIATDEERRRRLAQQSQPQQGFGNGRRLDGKQGSIKQSAANGSFGNKGRQSQIPFFNNPEPFTNPRCSLQPADGVAKSQPV